MTTYTFDRNPNEGMTIYSPGFLTALDTIHAGHFEDLKLHTGGLRYWLSRVSQEEGSGGWKVRVERTNGKGTWETILQYR